MKGRQTYAVTPNQIWWFDKELNKHPEFAAIVLYPGTMNRHRISVSGNAELFRKVASRLEPKMVVSVTGEWSHLHKELLKTADTLEQSG